jgi:hypothetical protein
VLRAIGDGNALFFEDAPEPTDLAFKIPPVLKAIFPSELTPTRFRINQPIVVGAENRRSSLRYGTPGTKLGCPPHVSLEFVIPLGPNARRRDGARPGRAFYFPPELLNAFVHEPEKRTHRKVYVAIAFRAVPRHAGEFFRVYAHCCTIIPLAKPAGKYYISPMKISEDVMREARRKLASKGGRARAAKYNKKTLSKWAKKGGRPRKDGGRMSTMRRKVEKVHIVEKGGSVPAGAISLDDMINQMPREALVVILKAVIDKMRPIFLARLLRYIVVNTNPDAVAQIAELVLNPELVLNHPESGPVRRKQKGGTR